MTTSDKAWASLAQAVITYARRDLIKGDERIRADALRFFNSYWYSNLQEMIVLVDPPKIEHSPSVNNEIH